MRAPISVVIPTLNAAAELPGCLAALAEGLDAGLIRELIISDGGSSDGTQRMAEAAGATLVTGPPGRGGQLKRGVETCAGVWVLALHADTQLSPGWSAPVLAHLQKGQETAGYFALAFRAQGLAPHLVAGWANMRSKRLGMPYGDQGLLILRTLYDQVGGYQDIPLMEDVALALALKGKLTPIAATAMTSAERYQREGWLRRGARNLWTLTRYRLGVDPQKLARSYQASPGQKYGQSNDRKA